LTEVPNEIESLYDLCGNFAIKKSWFLQFSKTEP